MNPTLLLDAIYFLARSWRRVIQATIANCFHKSGFGTLSTVEELDLIDEEPVLKEVTNGNDYLTIDKDVPCFDESDRNCDDDIIEGIISKRACIQDDSEDDEEDDVIVQTMVSHAIATEVNSKPATIFYRTGF